MGKSDARQKIINAIKATGGKMNELKKENEEMYNTFCRFVKKISKESGIAQKQLAAKIGISCSQFSKKINNQSSKFNLLQMYKLSQELCESIENIATGNV